MKKPDRLRFILKYAGDQIDEIVLSFIDALMDGRMNDGKVLAWIGNKPEVSDALYNHVVDICIKHDNGSLEGSRVFHRIKTVSSKSVLRVAEYLSSGSNIDGGATRIMLNHKYFTSTSVKHRPSGR